MSARPREALRRGAPHNLRADGAIPCSPLFLVRVHIPQHDQARESARKAPSTFPSIFWAGGAVAAAGVPTCTGRLGSTDLWAHSEAD